tara:strand:+ start:103755 stop:104252 length:498 start_codon:yes stop_codon:yes gene_type:complete
VVVVFLLLILGCSTKRNVPGLRPLLLSQLKYTHTEKDWFVPVKLAVAGVTAEQAKWKDGPNNHSIEELVSHLIFWNERVMIAFKGKNLPDFKSDNDSTFDILDTANWMDATKKLDSIQKEWEHSVERATEKELLEWSDTIASICAHNAYHTGQIIYIRKQNGWWE